MAKRILKKVFPWAFLLGAVLLSYLWLNPAGNLPPEHSIAAESVKVPAPKPGEKKVLLGDLGMT